MDFFNRAHRIHLPRTGLDRWGDPVRNDIVATSHDRTFDSAGSRSQSMRS